jgi:uncharacterized protein YndB with AHSA1/START domain
MAMAKPKPDDARVLRLFRSFAAPRDRVFRAFTVPTQMVKWWGPKGFMVPACVLDVRVGGAWHTVMRSPEGQDHIVSGVYQEITPPERLVFTWGWETEGVRGHETIVTIELVHRCIQRIQFGEDLAGSFGPGERLGIIVVFVNVAVDRGLQVDD